jgi:hypothetical protein
LVAFVVVDFDVCEVGVNTQTQIRRQCPWRGGPGE